MFTLRRLALSTLLISTCASCGGQGDAPREEPHELTPSPTATSATHVAKKPNVIVFLVDTLRADALGLYGYPKSTSPRIDAWARRGVVFEEATTPSGWTRPAVVSLFTGMYPAAHSVQDKEHIASEELVTLAEVLGDAGYSTHAVVTNFAVDEQFGTMQGFDEYRWFDKKVDSRPGTPPQLNYVPIHDLDREVSELLRPREDPFFLYVHTTDPHAPYIPPPDYRQFGADSRGRYDGEVRFTDEYIGRWLDLIEERGLLENSIVVFTADHGEEFLEHGGGGHGYTVFDECVRVPLIIWAPALSPGKRLEQVSLADLGPTILSAVGVKKPQGFAPQGRSFWREALNSSGRGGWTWSYHELVYPTKGITFAYRENDEKVVYIAWDKFGREDATFLYDVASDHLQQNDLSRTSAAKATALKQSMRSVRASHLEDAVEVITEPLVGDALERMRSLGYVD